uniref:thymidine kinase n=1 Tax=viral metagenome TaxID=1070528 RepID=A0A6C0LZT6_9ZZZZ
MNFVQGDIYLIVGPMFSGKSTELLRLLLLAKEAGRKCCYINHSLDTRESGTFSTHNPMTNRDLSAMGIVSFHTSSVTTVDVSEYDVVGIDEAQFFDHEIVPHVKYLSEDCGKIVILCGLNGTSSRTKFGHFIDLLPIASYVDWKFAVCKKCAPPHMSRAIFSHAILGGTSKIDIGGSDKYEALCRACFLKANV